MAILTDSQIDFFNVNGYLVIPGLLNHEEMQNIKNRTEEVAGYPEVPGKHIEQGLMSNEPRRVLSVTYNGPSEGDKHRQYYDDNRNSYPLTVNVTRTGSMFSVSEPWT